jgi:UDP-N-acetylmuramoylalanine--D-glutamate ligase
MCNFKNKKITVMGLGLHGGGVGTAKFLAEKGAQVLVTDIKTREQLKPSIEKLKEYKNIKFVLGQNRSEDFIKTDMIIKNPAVNNQSRYLNIARKYKVPIETDIGIFFEKCPCPIIGITGSKGKSTTASLAYKIFSHQLERTCLAGNIRISVLSCLNKLRTKSLAILELSSWQLEMLESHQKSPAVAVVLNILPDHLNSYKNFQSYVEAKKNIFLHQRKKDILVLNWEDPLTRSFADEAPGQVVFFGKQLPTNMPVKNKGAYLRKNSFYYKDEPSTILDLQDLPLLGEHNIYNVLATITLAKLYLIPDKIIRMQVKSFSALEGRLQLVSKINQIAYYNDTSATIPDATIAAIRTLKDKKKNIILITGGEDKELDYSSLAQTILEQVKKTILLEGSASDKLFSELKEIASKKQISRKIVRRNMRHMENIVQEATNQAKEEDIILFSPGAASFNLFENEFDRGQKFIREVNKIASNIK